MKALVLVIGLGLMAGCAPYPDYGSDSPLRQEQAEINQEAQASAERAQQNRIDQQQLQVRQQQQQQREEQQRMEQQPQPQSSGTPTSSQ